MKKYLILVLLIASLISHLSYFDEGSICRRVKSSGEISFILHQIKNGVGPREFHMKFEEGDDLLVAEGRSLPPISDEEPFMFLTLKLYRKGEPIAYYVIYPTTRGYMGKFSARRINGEFIQLGEMASSIMRGAKQTLGVWRDEALPVFNPSSFDKLEAYLAPYLYMRYLKEYPRSTLLAFVKAVDELKDEIDVSASTIARILSKSGMGDFSQYGLYYWMCKKYPGGVGRLIEDLKGIKRTYGIEGAEGRMVDMLKEVFSKGSFSDQVFKGLLYALGILSWKEYCPPPLSKLLEGAPPLYELEEAKGRIKADIENGVLGWVGVLDMDNLRLINRIFTKEIVNFVLGDIYRLISYYLNKEGGIVFKYLAGDELGVYLPEFDIEGIQLMFYEIRKAISELNYKVFTLSQDLNQEQLDRIRPILEKYDAYISLRKYCGYQMGIVRLDGGQGISKLHRMMNEVNGVLGTSVRIGLYLEGELDGRMIIPSFSAGIVSLANIELGDDMLQEGFYRAQDVLRAAKEKGRNLTLIGYKDEYRHQHTGSSLFSEGALERVSSYEEEHALELIYSITLTPELYNEDTLRKFVYRWLREGGAGTLIMLSPLYDGHRFKYINDVYSYQGGNDVIRALSYCVDKHFKGEFKDVLIGRRPPDRIYVFIPSREVKMEDLLELVNCVQGEFNKMMQQIDISFEIGCAYSNAGHRYDPGKIFQEVEYALLGEFYDLADLYGNRLYLYQGIPESEIAEIEYRIVSEALDLLMSRRGEGP